MNASINVWLILIMVGGAAFYIVASEKYSKPAELGRICFWVALLVFLARWAKL